MLGLGRNKWAVSQKHKLIPDFFNSSLMLVYKAGQIESNKVLTQPCATQRNIKRSASLQSVTQTSRVIRPY